MILNNLILEQRINSLVKIKTKILQFKQLVKKLFIYYNHYFIINKKSWVANIYISYYNALKKLFGYNIKFYINKVEKKIV